LQQTISGNIQIKNNTYIIRLFLAYIVKIYSFFKINPQVTKALSTQLGTSENIRLLSIKRFSSQLPPTQMVGGHNNNLKFIE
jgi:hypothetical protein